MTDNDTAAVTDASGVVDLRPKEGSVKYELLRLGLKYVNGGAEEPQTWANYDIQLLATVPPDAGTVEFTDLSTGETRSLTADKLPGVSSVKTILSDPIN